MFNEIDKDKDHLIKLNDLQDAINRHEKNELIGLLNIDLTHDLFKKYDTQNSRHINYAQFSQLIKELEKIYPNELSYQVTAQKIESR